MDYIENIARTELGDIAEAVRKDLVPVFTKPIIPSSPSVPTDQTDLLAMAAYKADLEEFEMYTRPIFLEKVKSQFKLEEKMKEDNKKLYAFLKRSMSPELRDRVELRAADYKAAHDISDGLAYLLLVNKEGLHRGQWGRVHPARLPQNGDRQVQARLQGYICPSDSAQSHVSSPGASG